MFYFLHTLKVYTLVAPINARSFENGASLAPLRLRSPYWRHISSDNVAAP